MPHAPRQEHHLEGVDQHDGHQYRGSYHPEPPHRNLLRLIRQRACARAHSRAIHKDAIHKNMAQPLSGKPRLLPSYRDLGTTKKSNHPPQHQNRSCGRSPTRYRPQVSNPWGDLRSGISAGSETRAKLEPWRQPRKTLGKGARNPLHPKCVRILLERSRTCTRSKGLLQVF